MTKNKHSLITRQDGIVSFFVVLIIMLVLSLIVMAFGQLVRREQRQTLDRQLNTQAFYAAESGINDAREALANNPTLGNQDYDECTGPTSFVFQAGLTNASQLDGPGGVVSYSCLLVDTSPSYLDYPVVPTGESVVVPINPANGASANQLQISWEDRNGPTALSGCPALPHPYPAQPNTTCPMGVLRLELVPFNTTRSRTDLLRDRMIVFIHPSPTGDGTLSFSEATGDFQGLRQAGNCNSSGPTGTRQCMLTVTLNGASANMRTGYLRMRAIYRPLSVTIRAFGAPGRLDLHNAQAEVDVTGRASDVLKRLKATVPIPGGSEFFPEYALQSARTQCKRMMLTPPNTIIFGLLLGDTTGASNPCNPRQTINN